jgi:transcriptional regulator with XRE-family HTH domain
MSIVNWSSDELEERLGARIRALRIARNLDQAAVADKAGLSVRTIKNLENGRGSSVSTLVKVVRALDRAEWLETLSPEVVVSPLRMLASERRASVPQRVSRSAARRAVGAPVDRQNGGSHGGSGGTPGGGSDSAGDGDR